MLAIFYILNQNYPRLYGLCNSASYKYSLCLINELLFGSINAPINNNRLYKNYLYIICSFFSSTK